MNKGRKLTGSWERPCDGGGKDFIPCLPNDVVLQHVATKVPWKTMFTLACVNRAWRIAIRSRQVYEVRKGSSSAQSLIVFRIRSTRQWGFYNFEQQEFFLLPPNGPPLEKTEAFEQVVFLDGKIFVVAEPCPGSTWSSGSMIGSIQVLDVAACQLVWMDYSSAKVNSYTDTCVPCVGRIYAFHIEELLPGKVFDPVRDEWNDVAKRRFEDDPGTFAQAVTLNNDIFLVSSGRPDAVYNLGTEKWQSIEDTSENAALLNYVKRCVAMGGKLYRLSRTTVEELTEESGTRTWTCIQSISFKGVIPPVQIARNIFRFPAGGVTPWPPIPVAMAPLGREVLAVLSFDSGFRALYKSVGFGVKGQCLMWETSLCQRFEESLKNHGSFDDSTISLFEGSVEF